MYMYITIKMTELIMTPKTIKLRIASTTKLEGMYNQLKGSVQKQSTLYMYNNVSDRLNLNSPRHYLNFKGEF